MHKFEKKTCFSANGGGAMKRRLACAAIAAMVSASFADTLTWKGGNGSFDNAENWTSDGSHAVPQNGDQVILSSTSAATIANDIESLSLSSVVLASDSAAVTVAGDFAGMTAVTNLSSAGDLTFEGHVDFVANNIDVKQNAAVPGSSPYNPTGTRVVFSGGVTGNDIANHSVFSGNYTLTKSAKFSFASPSSGNKDRPTIYENSTFTVGLSDNTSNVQVMPGASYVANVQTNSWNSGHNWICAWNRGEFVVKREYVLFGSGNVYFGGNASSDVSVGKNAGGIMRLNKVVLQDGYGWLQPYRNTNTKSLSYDLYVGSGGLCFGSASGSHYVLKDAHTAVTLHPWKSDFALAASSGTRQLLLRGDGGSPVLLTLDTTDEDGVPRTITFDGKVETLSTANSGSGGASGILVRGTGTNVWNSASTAFYGTNTVTETASLLMGAGASLANGTVSVFGTATFGVKESGTASVGTLNMDSGATLAFNFTQRDAAPTLEIAIGASVPATLSVKVSCDAGLNVSAVNTYTLTLGYDFTGKTVNLVDKPDWVRSVDIVDGNLVLTVKSKGLMLIVM